MPERTDQKNRTREALLEGARRLIERGGAVSVTAAAAEMGISKATAYRYFSDPSVLAAEAGLAVEVIPYEQVVGEAGESGSLRAKLMAITLYFFDLALAHEPAFRQFLARSQDAWAHEPRRVGVRRGARRVRMYGRALEEAGVERARAEALIRALVPVTGAEAMIALYDVAGASPDEAREAVRAGAEALIGFYLGEDAERGSARDGSTRDGSTRDGADADLV